MLNDGGSKPRGKRRGAEPPPPLDSHLNHDQVVASLIPSGSRRQAVSHTLPLARE